RRLLVAYKFRGMTGLGPLISGIMADVAGPAPAGLAVVPVPPSRPRHRYRGFDPLELPARTIAGSLPGAAFYGGALVRHGSGRQRGRGRAGRLAAPPDTRIGPRPVAPDQPVLLIDDVITTGATLAAAASALQRGESGPVTAITFTRRL
ncbi:MAG: ComF family protein, partial [Actinomycetota bacterium]|nr:ComF family protein [Actinomycetota bacterium]